MRDMSSNPAVGPRWLRALRVESKSWRASAAAYRASLERNTEWSVGSDMSQLAAILGKAGGDSKRAAKMDAVELKRARDQGLIW
jgi:hypothetical protein